VPRQRSSPPLGVVEKEVAVLVVLVRRHRCAVGAAVRRAVDDEVPGAVEEEAGPAAPTTKTELELIQSHMAQKPVLRGEVGCACDQHPAPVVLLERGGHRPVGARRSFDLEIADLIGRGASAQSPECAGIDNLLTST